MVGRVTQGKNGMRTREGQSEGQREREKEREGGREGGRDKFLPPPIEQSAAEWMFFRVQGHCVLFCFVCCLHIVFHFFVCGFVVPAEKVMSLGRNWHRPCLRCERCNKTLTSGGHAEVLHQSSQTRLCTLTQKTNICAHTHR